MPKTPKAYNLLDFMRDYPTDNACLDKILEMRYGLEPVCDACGKRRSTTESRNGARIPVNGAGRTSTPAQGRRLQSRERLYENGSTRCSSLPRRATAYRRKSLNGS